MRKIKRAKLTHGMFYLIKTGVNPGEVRFDKLSNWIDSQEEGIKYYSGKATYRKVFDMGNVQKKFFSCR